MKKFLISILFFCFCAISFAQNRTELYSDEDLANKVFQNEWSFGVKLHTNGFGANFERVWIKSIWKRNVLQTNFFYYKDFKQKRIKTPYAQVYNAPGYFYGKQNNFFNFNVLYGQKKVLAEKADNKGVRLSMFYLGGVSLGILKPYALTFVNTSQPDPNTLELYNEVYTENLEDKFLGVAPGQDPVYGAAGIFQGFNKIRPIPGVHAKFGFNFDWASYEYVVKSIEIGAQLDIYYKKLPVMITERNKPYILSLYLAFQIGKRW